MAFIGTKEIVATIAAAASLSDAVDCGGGDILRISMPAAWTDAAITFQVDDGEGTYRDLFMEWGLELGVWADAGDSVETSIFLGLQQINNIKVRSGTSGAPVAQAAEREIILVVGVKG
jgi:hypothetical protein